MTAEHEASAKAASILVDLLGVESFANDAVAEIEKAAPLSPTHRELIHFGALQAATIICDLLRQFSGRAEVTAELRAVAIGKGDHLHAHEGGDRTVCGQMFDRDEGPWGYDFKVPPTPQCAKCVRILGLRGGETT